MTQLVTNGSPLFLTRVQVADADYTVTQTNGLSIVYTSLTASRVINLPASSLSPGQIIQVVDETGNCTSTVTLTLTPNGTDTIEGKASKTISYPYGSVTIENSGTGKWVITTNPNPNLSAGMQIQPSFTDLGTGSCTIGTGTYCLYANSDGTGKIKSYVIAGNTFTLTDLTTNHIVANYNAGSPVLQVITDVTLINETTIIPVFTIYRQGTILHVFEWDQLGDALTNKIHKSIVKTQRYRLESGLGIGEAATRLVTVGSGTVWTGAVPTVAAAFNSSVNTLQFAYHVAGVWTFSTVTQYNNTQYDDGTNLQATPGAKYVVNFIYRSVGTDTECFYVLGNQAYTLFQAQASQPPGSLPAVISSHCILVGRIIVQQGASTATQIDSAFATLFTPSASVDHNSLSNIQGGTASQYYHLTSAEYTGTGTGNFVRAGSPALTGTPTAPTATLSDNSTTIATTAFVKGQGYITSGMTNPMTTAGDMIYGGTAGAPTRLPIGTANYWLKVVGGNPVWTALTSGDVTGALGYIPINKAGDSGIGNLSMSALTATTGAFRLDQTAPTRLRVDNQTANAASSAGIDLEAWGGGWMIDVPYSATYSNPLLFKFNGGGAALAIYTDNTAIFASSVSMGALTATTGTFSGAVTVATAKTSIYTVATLPAGSDGMRAFVSDATATTFASAVVGGGTNHVPVYYDGGTSSWKIG